MTEYDLIHAFEKIENDLIDSMIRNFKHHRAEETKEGYNWTQWQVEQLKAFEVYKTKNKEIFDPQFSTINDRIAEMLRQTKNNAAYSQERKILNAVKNGFQPNRASAQSSAEFFKIDERKLNALVKSTTDDLKKAEYAVLRMANDKYRKAIFNAQVFANSGAATYEKAVDSAVKDMLAAGLNCVQYKNGARHTLPDYADMAIRTANKRAYLRGEGEKAQEWGISTVIINRRNGACGKCADFVGMVFIDDVYAGGKKTDEGGKYPLLSEAISAGLFHPRCKDSSSLYIEGISTPPDKEVLPKEAQEELSEIERLEQRINYGNRKQKMYSRLAKYALDSDNKTAYTAKAERWKKYTDYWTGKYEKRLENAATGGIIREKEIKSVSYAKDISKAKKYFNDKYNVIIDTSVDNLDYESVNEALQGIEEVLIEFPKAINSLKGIGVSTDYGIMNASYDGIISFNSSCFTERKKAIFACSSPSHYHPTGNNIISTGAHETGHILEKALIDKSLGGEQPVGSLFWKSGEQAKEIVKQACKNAKKTQQGKKKRNVDLIREISGYADKGGNSECLAEAVADYVLNKNKAAPLSKEIWKILKLELN